MSNTIIAQVQTDRLTSSTCVLFEVLFSKKTSGSSKGGEICKIDVLCTKKYNVLLLWWRSETILLKWNFAFSVVVLNRIDRKAIVLDFPLNNQVIGRDSIIYCRGVNSVSHNCSAVRLTVTCFNVPSFAFHKAHLLAPDTLREHDLECLYWL